MEEKNKRVLLLSKYLLAFIFCGVIIGETLTLTMVVTIFGASTVGKMYLVNALLLLIFPVFFFRYVDAINRGRLLANSLISVAAIVVVSSLLYQFVGWDRVIVKLVTILMYPVSYMSKTLLFLTFWTYLNDIYTVQDAKVHFPVIAAWGFCGAIAGVVLGRILLELFGIQTVMWLWALVYIIAWYIDDRMKNRLEKLKKRRVKENALSDVLDGISLLVKNRLLVIISFIYFGTFLTVFTIDYLFWTKCASWLGTAEKIASFQFVFYIGHASVTVLLLWLLLPRIIGTIGFTRVMYGLPLLFMITGVITMLLNKNVNGSNGMVVATVTQFFRHVLFELTFATSYQVLFVVIVRDLRGRAKTLLEGVAKPAAIFASGLAIVLIGGRNGIIAGGIAVMGFLLLVVIYYLRFVYIKTVMEKVSPHLEMNEVIDIAGKNESKTFYKIVREYAESEYEDFKVMAVYLLRKVGTPYAFTYLEELYKHNPVQRVKELIAGSISIFYSYQTRTFVENLLREKNNRIRSNTIKALNDMQCNWKKHLKPLIAPFLFENDQRVQIEAAVFLWSHGTGYEKNTVLQFLDSLIGSDVPNRRAAGIYLTGLIKVEGWENVLLRNMTEGTIQVYTKATEILLKNGTEKDRVKALCRAQNLSRRHITVIGKLMERECVSILRALQRFISMVEDRRMMFEAVKALRKAVDILRLSGKGFAIDKETTRCIRRWIIGELKNAYLDAFHYNVLKNEEEVEGVDMLGIALREKYLRMCNWAISAIVLTDSKGIFVWRSIDMDVHDLQKKQDVIEILESMPQDKICTLVLPILKVVGWETLAKIGKMYFRFGIKESDDGFAYFLESENRFVVLCTLYCLELNLGILNQRKVLQGSMNMLKRSEDERISTTAEEIVKSKRETDDKHSRAFELLERVLFFKKCFLFHNIGAEKLLRVVELAQMVTLKKSETLSAIGRLNDKVFILKTGKLRIERDKLGTIEIGAGETYGEEGLFANIIGSINITAEEDSEVYVLKKADIRRIIRELPDIALNFLEAITNKLLKKQAEQL